MEGYKELASYCHFCPAVGRGVGCLADALGEIHVVMSKNENIFPIKALHGYKNSFYIPRS